MQVHYLRSKRFYFLGSEDRDACAHYYNLRVFRILRPGPEIVTSSVQSGVDGCERAFGLFDECVTLAYAALGEFLADLCHVGYGLPPLLRSRLAVGSEGGRRRELGA